MDTQARAAAISENVWLTIIARVSMVLSFPVLGFTGWLFLDWLDGRFDSVTIPLKAVELRVNSLEGRSNSLDLVIENHRLRIERSEQDGGRVADEVNGMGKQIGEVNTSLQGLIGILSDRDSRPNRRMGANQ